MASRARQEKASVIQNYFEWQYYEPIASKIHEVLRRAYAEKIFLRNLDINMDKINDLLSGSLLSYLEEYNVRAFLGQSTFVVAKTKYAIHLRLHVAAGIQTVGMEENLGGFQEIGKNKHPNGKLMHFFTRQLYSNRSGKKLDLFLCFKPTRLNGNIVPTIPTVETVLYICMKIVEARADGNECEIRNCRITFSAMGYCSPGLTQPEESVTTVRYRRRSARETITSYVTKVQRDIYALFCGETTQLGRYVDDRKFNQAEIGTSACDDQNCGMISCYVNERICIHI